MDSSASRPPVRSNKPAPFECFSDLETHPTRAPVRSNKPTPVECFSDLEAHPARTPVRSNLPVQLSFPTYPARAPVRPTKPAPIDCFDDLVATYSARAPPPDNSLGSGRRPVAAAAGKLDEARKVWTTVKDHIPSEHSSFSGIHPAFTNNKPAEPAFCDLSMPRCDPAASASGRRDTFGCSGASSAPASARKPPVVSEGPIFVPDDTSPLRKRPASTKIVPRKYVIRSIDDPKMSNIKQMLQGGASAIIDQRTTCLLDLLVADLPRITMWARGRTGDLPNDVTYIIRIFGIVSDIDDIDGIFDWITSPVANSLFYCYSTKKMGGGLSTTNLFGNTKIYKWADRVFITSAEALSFVNGLKATSTKKIEEFVFNVFGEILSLGASIFPTVKYPVAGAVILLIPYTVSNSHWYLFCIYITHDMTRLIVFNSVKGTDYRFLSDALHTGIQKHSNMFTGKPSVDHGKVIRYEKYGQGNGRDCGVYMVFYAAKIQNEPGWVRVIIDAPASEHAYSANAGKLFDVAVARNNMCLGIFHLFSIRQDMEETAALSYTVDGIDYNPDAVYAQRVKAVTDFMRTNNVNLLLDHLKEFNFSPQDTSDMAPDDSRSTANPLTCTVHQYYESAPHVTRWYAGVGRTVSSGSSKRDVCFTLDDFVNSLDRDPSLHDKHHGWIQTAFATDEKSMHNPSSPLLTRQDCAFLQHSPVLAQRLLFVVVRYGFNGIGIDHNHGVLRAPLGVLEAELFEQRVLKDTHYRARISRLLYFLRLTGFEHLAHELYALLMSYQNQGRIINYAKSHVEWRKAITRELWSGHRA